MRAVAGGIDVSGARTPTLVEVTRVPRSRFSAHDLILQPVYEARKNEPGTVFLRVRASFAQSGVYRLALIGVSVSGAVSRNEFCRHEPDRPGTTSARNRVQTSCGAGETPCAGPTCVRLCSDALVLCTGCPHALSPFPLHAGDESCSHTPFSGRVLPNPRTMRAPSASASDNMANVDVYECPRSNQ